MFFPLNTTSKEITITVADLAKNKDFSECADQLTELFNALFGESLHIPANTDLVDVEESIGKRIPHCLRDFMEDAYNRLTR